MCTIEFQPAIETSRLRLRRPVRADVTALAPAKPVACVKGQDRASFVIEHPEHGAIGGLSFASDGPQRTDFACWIGEGHRNHGYATEATRAALGWAHKVWKRRHVHARHFSDDPAAGQVLCKAGFLYTGDVILAPTARGPAPARMMVWLA
jgi:RimJ/RimL family protein N-acetyltransferase